MEDPRPEFSYLPGFSEVKTSCEEKAYDLVVLLDAVSYTHLTLPTKA